MRENNHFVKIIGLTFLLICSGLQAARAQYDTYLSYMDKLHQSGAFSPASLPTDNLNANLVDRSYELEAMLVMYKKTKQLKWLHSFVALADRVLNARDDMHLASFGGGSYSTPNYLGQVKATWITDKLEYTYGMKYAYVYHSGMFTHPMAEFCYIVSQNPVMFQSVYLNNPDGFFYTTQNLKTISDDLVEKLKETVGAHEVQWRNKILGNGAIGGNYHFDCNVIAAYHFNNIRIMAGGSIPLNMQAAFGKTLLYLYLCLPGTDADKAPYLERLIRICNTLRFNMTSSTPAGSAHYIWHYYDIDEYASGNEVTVRNSCTEKYLSEIFNYGPNYIEDWGHSIVNISFAYLCHKHNIPYSLSSSTPAFDLNDMKKIAATFKNFYRRPMIYSNNIDGSGNLSFTSYNFTSAGCTDPYPCSIESMGQWLMYSEFDKDIYQMVSEIYTKHALDKHLPSWPGVLGIAYSHYYKNNLNPIDVGEGGANSNWTATAIGDLNNDGKDEVVCARNIDGDLFILNWQTNPGKLYEKALRLVQLLPNGDASDWRGIAIGNFDGQPGNELAAIRNFDNTVYVWKNTATSGGISMTGWKIIPISDASNWVGLAAGNFDVSDGSDELALLSNSTGDTYLYDYQTGSGSFYRMATLNNNNTSQWSGIAAGNVNNDAKDEIIQASNLDGDIYIYGLYGANINQVGQKYDAPSNIQWRGITTGDFDEDSNDEIVLNARSDGDLYFFSFSANTISGFHREYFAGPVNSLYLENGVLACGNVTGSNENCVAELINFRNSDGWNYLYNYQIGGSSLQHIKECYGKIKEKEKMDVSDITETYLAELEMETYPNPAQDNLNIRLNLVSDAEKTVKLNLTNIQGLLINEIIINEPKIGSNVHEMNVSNLPGGIYFITLNYGQQQLIKKVIIE